MMTLLVVLFFQAEDGIRDLVRSRGLGDVYKRQLLEMLPEASIARTIEVTGAACEAEADKANGTATAVSYTHLTLPTSDLV